MLALVLVAAFGIAAETVPACDRGAPQPLGFHSRGFGYVAEVFPPKSRHNRGSRPVAYLYEVGYPGSEWRVQARRLWTAALPHELMPQAALVSMAGQLVTLDDHHQAGAGPALVIYDLGGRLVRSFTLVQLLEPSDLARVTVSDCGRLWRERARFFFTSTGDAKLFVLLHWGRVLELRLATGELKRGLIASFPALRDIAARRFPNEETEVWMLSLRFSSLSDFVPPR